MHFLKLEQSIVNPVHVIGMTSYPTPANGVDVLLSPAVAESLMSETTYALGTTDDDVGVVYSCADAEATAICTWARQHPAMEEVLPGYFLNRAYLIGIEPHAGDDHDAVAVYVRQPAATVLFETTACDVFATFYHDIAIVQVAGSDAEDLRDWTQQHPDLVSCGGPYLLMDHLLGWTVTTDAVELACPFPTASLLFRRSGYEIIEEEGDIEVVRLTGAAADNLRVAMEAHRS